MVNATVSRNNDDENYLIEKKSLKTVGSSAPQSFDRSVWTRGKLAEREKFVYARIWSRERLCIAWHCFIHTRFWLLFWCNSEEICVNMKVEITFCSIHTLYLEKVTTMLLKFINCRMKSAVFLWSWYGEVGSDTSLQKLRVVSQRVILCVSLQVVADPLTSLKPSSPKWKVKTKAWSGRNDDQNTWPSAKNKFRKNFKREASKAKL